MRGDTCSVRLVTVIFNDAGLVSAAKKVYEVYEMLALLATCLPTYVGYLMIGEYIDAVVLCIYGLCICHRGNTP